MSTTIDTDMTVVDFLRRNAQNYPNKVALVEVNPQRQENRHITWRDYDLVETTEDEPFRREITWAVFDEKANRFANLLLSRGIRKGDKVAILLYNCIEWLPIYFGVLKTGATAVPLNFRYASDEIKYCLDKADVDVLVFGPEFIGRLENIVPQIQPGRLLFYVGDDCPTWAEPYQELANLCSSRDPMIPLSNSDDAAIYYTAPPPEPDPGRADGAEAPRPDAGRRLPVHSAAIPHRCQVPLDGLAHQRRQGGAAARRLSAVHF